MVPFPSWWEQLIQATPCRKLEFLSVGPSVAIDSLEIDLIGVATDPLLHEDTVGDRIDGKLSILELTQHSWIRRLH